MSEEFVSGCIQHRDTRHLRLYYDYMDIYSDNEYKAKIIRILETWTDHKRAEWYKTNSDRLEQGQEFLEPDFWITMSYQQFRYYMRHTASEDTLKKALVELEQAKHIKRRVNPEFPYGPPQYLLNSRVIQAALNKLTTPPLVPDLPPQEDTPPPGKTIPPQEITPTQGVELPLPRGVKTGRGGRKNTPTLGGKIGTSNITTKNYLEDVIDSDKEESMGEQSDTTTSTPSLSLDAAPSSSPQSEIETHSQQGDTHGTILPTGDTDLHRPLECNTAPGITQDASGDTHGTTSTQQQEIARTCDTCGRPQTQADCSWCMTTRLPAIPKQTSSLPSAVEPGRSGGPTPGAPAPLPGGTSHNKKASQVQDRDATPLSDTQSVPASTRTAECEPRLTPSQPGVKYGPTDRTTDIFLQEPPKAETDEGEALHGQNRSATPPRSVAVEGDSGCITPASAPQVPPGVAPPHTMRATVVPAPLKWDAQAMLARAEALREKPFSESARPKETRSARKLFARKPDLTEEEFTSAFQHWNTPWWHETNGPFCITDLAAVPKNKSEMRLIIALEKLAMPKKPPGGQVIQMPTTRGQQWRSSFDDPDYDMSAEFYPGTIAR